MIRLNKYIALNLKISRRAADELIENNLIHVNGSISKLGQKIDEDKDVIKYLGKNIKQEKKRYYIFYKPVGYICSHNRQSSTPTIYQIIKDKSLKYAGRLDKESEGLLLLSNDGDWINELTHPKYNIEKIYHLTVEDVINTDKFQKVVKKEDNIYKINSIKKLNKEKYEVILTTGKKREIREIFTYNKVIIKTLKRVQMGQYTLGNMNPGEIKEIYLKDTHGK